MLIKFLLCLVVVDSLALESTVGLSYDTALEKLEKFLQSRAASVSPVDNIQAVQRFNKENTYITRENVEIVANRAAHMLFHLFGSLKVDKPQICDSYEIINTMNTILGEKACRPKLNEGGRVERTVHEVCKRFARECIHEWSRYYRLRGRTYFEKSFDIFLKDSQSMDLVDPTAKIKQMQTNLNGPEAGVLLVMAIYNQMSPIVRFRAIQNAENNLEKFFEERVVVPCLQLESRRLQSFELAIKTFEPDEMPIDQDAMMMHDASNFKIVCQTLLKEKAEYIKKARQALSG